jgi:hypothetical protein
LQNLFLKGHGFNSLRKNSILSLLLGGAALQRCDNSFVLTPPLGAEVAFSAAKRIFPQSV